MTSARNRYVYVLLGAPCASASSSHVVSSRLVPRVSLDPRSRDMSLEERAASYLAGVEHDLVTMREFFGGGRTSKNCSVTTTLMPKAESGFGSNYAGRLQGRTFTPSLCTTRATAIMATVRGTWATGRMTVWLQANSFSFGRKACQDKAVSPY